MCAIWAHESKGGTYVRQLGFSKDSPRGAFGEFQMEQGAVQSVQRYLGTRPDLELRAGVWVFQDPWTVPDWHVWLDSLAFCRLSSLWDRFACLMARLYLMQFQEPVPHGVGEIAKYAKKYWNTDAGKATGEDYEEAFKRYFW